MITKKNMYRIMRIVSLFTLCFQLIFIFYYKSMPLTFLSIPLIYNNFILFLSDPFIRSEKNNS